MSDARLDEVTLRAIGRLLSAAQRVGVGVWFEPVERGWAINYMEGRGGGPLGEGSTLLAACSIALARLRQGWPGDPDRTETDWFVVILPEHGEAIAWAGGRDEYIQCIARNVSGKRCRNGIFDDQPGPPVKIFGGPGGVGYSIESDTREYSGRADLQRCGTHLHRENSEAVGHEGKRFRATIRDHEHAILS